MEISQIIVLALVQGLTEFLPISSSAHLVLVPKLLKWSDQGLAFDVAVHLGSLLAVIWYFRQDISELTRSWIESWRTKTLTTQARLAWGIGLGTIPAGLAGLMLKDYIEVNLRSPLVIAATTIIFGLLLWFADVYGKRARNETSITWLDIIVIGAMQVLALIPGTSRSGITITAGLLLGLTREAAARFSFLLAIPIILLSGGKISLDLVLQTTAVDWSALVLGTLLSAISAYFCIHYFLKLIQSVGMLPFVIYRLVLGGFLWFMFA